MPGWSRDCENCGQRYVATYPTQRWCCAECREEFRNAELRAARLLWRASLASHLSTLWSTAENANEKAQAKKASEARAEVRALDQSRGKGAFETSAEFSGRKNKGPRMTTTTEDLHAVVLRAQRAGHTCAFVGADVTVNGKVPDYLLMPPSAAEKFERLHPEAQRLRIEELKIFIENKVKAKREAQIEETENAKA